jgi:hypothetical protein
MALMILLEGKVPFLRVIAVKDGFFAGLLWEEREGKHFTPRSGGNVIGPMTELVPFPRERQARGTRERSAISMMEEVHLRRICPSLVVSES